MSLTGYFSFSIHFTVYYLALRLDYDNGFMPSRDD